VAAPSASNAPSPLLLDKVVVVTGAAGGQGASEALAAARHGAQVVATDLEPPQLGDPRIHARALDVTAGDSWEALAGWIAAELGRVDGLVNNAGITSRVGIGEVSLEEWNRVIAVNATGAFLGIQTLMPLMGRGSSIVNVASVAGLGAHYAVAYTASKWALRGITMSAAAELGPRGIRVNVIHPGFIATPMTASAPPAFREINEALTPLSRVGEPGEVASLVTFLLSDEASFINGVEIPIDGGFASGASAKAISDAMRRTSDEAPR